MENKEFKAAVVTFTTVTHKDETSQTSLTLSRGKRSYPDLHTFVQDMKDDHWNLLSENMRAGMSRHEFSAKCMDIVAWVMESTSTVVVPALDLTMQIELSDSPSSSGSGSNEAGEVTSLGRSVRFSCSGGPSRCTSARTACSTCTPTPFPSSHRYLALSLSSAEFRAKAKHIVTEDIVNIIMQDLESVSQYTVDDADSFPLGEKKSQLKPRVVFDNLLDAAQTMYHRVKDRLNIFFSFPPVSVTTAKYVLDSTPVETLIRSKSADTALVEDRSRPPSVRS
ncbi:uncharacterized protein LOC121562522 [Coregonus clupeaformis]|uniref:uncharacterized protein LOC121562522 n=1 Tax=Coregonus clupeaformis TaxID=59861 RepID=UPI001E1C35C9|nr:uncharacterized protein LOC121562522 [Coregonus clupeaformis]